MHAYSNFARNIHISEIYLCGAESHQKHSSLMLHMSCSSEGIDFNVPKP